MRLRGFTLIEIVVVLFIMGVILAMSATLMRNVAAGQQGSNTRAALARTDLALLGFVEVMRRLPCPADGALASSDPNAGRERRSGASCDADEARGVVPWVTLGMKEDDVLDGYGTRLTYRVAGNVVTDDALKMNQCDAAGSAGPVPSSPGWCDTACVDHAAGLPNICTKPLNAILTRGLRVQTSTGAALNDPAAGTGAAYVVISHGANHGGGYGTAGVLQESTTPLTAAEMQNAALPVLAGFYVDDSAVMDDILSRPPLMNVVIQAGLGPRIHSP